MAIPNSFNCKPEESNMKKGYHDDYSRPAETRSGNKKVADKVTNKEERNGHILNSCDLGKAGEEGKILEIGVQWESLEETAGTLKDDKMGLDSKTREETLEDSSDPASHDVPFQDKNPEYVDADIVPCHLMDLEKRGHEEMTSLLDKNIDVEENSLEKRQDMMKDEMSLDSKTREETLEDSSDPASHDVPFQDKGPKDDESTASTNKINRKWQRLINWMIKNLPVGNILRKLFLLFVFANVLHVTNAKRIKEGPFIQNYTIASGQHLHVTNDEDIHQTGTIFFIWIRENQEKFDCAQWNVSAKSGFIKIGSNHSYGGLHYTTNKDGPLDSGNANLYYDEAEMPDRQELDMCIQLETPEKEVKYKIKITRLPDQSKNWEIVSYIFIAITVVLICIGVAFFVRWKRRGSGESSQQATYRHVNGHVDGNTGGELVANGNV